MKNLSGMRQLSIAALCWVIAGAFSISFGMYLAGRGAGFLYTGSLSLFVGFGIIAFKDRIIEIRRKIIMRHGRTKQ